MRTPTQPRRLSRAERAVAYGLLGWATEIVFTAIEGAVHRQTRDARLQGVSYLWMGPIYGLCAILFEPARDLLRGRPAAQRAAAYATGIIGVEYVTGRLFERATGVIPWDYTGRSPLVIHGATRLDYAPLWAAAGLALERVDDALRSARVSWED
ncbi:MAG: hypothetical protein JF887_05225 [Candidatus Dormibacteraeota bacterium]|uniref:Uncharacterized protein n=1 Tax=Candidatus Amunia macphersoniae TaxID=3127014 RepID=A0A934KMQ0_9BACT|nr:hypothetical protein [Candidatus Dormibacteraeota bacterium]